MQGISLNSEFYVDCHDLIPYIYSHLSIFQKVNWPSGKVLGGSSSINMMLYLRGNAHDYDQWAANGCTGWEYDRILPYFLRSENNLNKRYTRTGVYQTIKPSKYEYPVPNSVVIIDNFKILHNVLFLSTA